MRIDKIHFLTIVILFCVAITILTNCKRKIVFKEEPQPCLIDNNKIQKHSNVDKGKKDRLEYPKVKNSTERDEPDHLHSAGKSRSVQILIEALKSNVKSERENAVRLLKDVGKDAAVGRDVLFSAALAEDEYISAYATYILYNLGEINSKKVIKKIIDLLMSKDAYYRQDAPFLIMDMGIKALPAVPFLIAALNNSSDAIFRDASIMALSKLGKKSRVVVEQLVKTTAKDNKAMVKLNIYILSRIGINAKYAISKILEWLTVDDKEVLFLVLKTLRNIGSEAKPAISILVELRRKETDNFLRDQIEFTIRSIKGIIK